MKTMVAMSEMATVTIAPGSSLQSRDSFNANPPIKNRCDVVIADRSENTSWMTKTLLRGFEILAALLVWINLGFCLHAEQVDRTIGQFVHRGLVGEGRGPR